jgi:hypothetical protein
MAYDPITWRNVSGPNLAEAARPLQLAQQGLTSGFGTLADQLKSMENVDRANWEQQKVNNTNEFLNQIYAAKGPEGFKAMQDSGQLQQLLTSFGAQIDQARAREVMDTRLGTLQDRAVKDINYKNTMLEDAQAPEVRRIQTLALTDPKAAKAELDKNPDLLKAFEVAKLIDSQGQILVDRDRAATRFGWEEKEAPVRLKGLELTNQSKGQEITLGGYRIKEAKQGWEDRVAARELEDTIARAGAEHSVQRDAQGRAQGALVAKINEGIADPKLRLPVDARGHADFSNMTKEQIQQFDQAARVTGVPLAATTISGDTNRADDFYARLTASGKFSPRLLKANENTIRSAFNSPVGERALVGNDAFNSRLATAQNKVYFDQLDSKSWYAPGSPNATKAYESLASEVPNLIDKTSGFGTAEDVSYLQDLVHEMGQKGIEVAPGKFVTPSVEDMRNAIRTAGGGWFLDSTRASNARAILKKSLQDAATKQKIADAAKSEEWRNKQRVKEELSKAYETK